MSEIIYGVIPRNNDYLIWNKIQFRAAFSLYQILITPKIKHTQQATARSIDAYNIDTNI